MAAYTNVVMVADTTDVTSMMGAGVNAAYTTTMQDDVGVYLEGYLCCVAGYDFVTNWATIGAIAKLMLSEFVARGIACEGIKYDMGTTATYTSRVEAEDMINYHVYRMEKIEGILKEAGTLKFIQT